MAKKTDKKEDAAAGVKSERKFPLMRKITAKNVMGQAIKDIAREYESGSVVELFSIAGQIVRCQPISTQYGDSMKFRGKFRVIRTADKKVWEGSEFFAPGDFENELMAAWAGRGEDQTAIEFAATVSLQVDEDANTGYVFVTEPLVEAAPSSALEDIISKAGLKALAAPK
jgi:hypothetical protein